MLIQDIIRKKRDGESLDLEEIQAIVNGIADQTLSEGQVASFAMATFFQGMPRSECMALTHAMQNSGTTLNWQDLELGGPVVDKHSSGGVGDKVSIMLAPMLAACGAYVPMISGRGLGHTGGTLDKLDSIQGYRSQPDIVELQKVVKEVGCAIVGQTAELAPADKRFYSIRDVTATVESVPLITASILSKKLSAGLDSLVMDIKTGNGAFAASREMASELAENIVAVGSGLGLPITALITDMSEVLGRTAGNALEILETVQYLKGEFKEPRLHRVVVDLGAELLVLSKLSPTLEDAVAKMEDSLSSGKASEYFSRMVSALGGPSDFMDRPEHYLDAAPIIVPVHALQSGTVNLIDTRSVGNAVVELGGGRRLVEDIVDPAVGLSEVLGLGEQAGPDRPLAMLHARDQKSADAAIARLQAAFTIGDEPNFTRPGVILERIQH